jgi:hypothetical protein
MAQPGKPSCMLAVLPGWQIPRLFDAGAAGSRRSSFVCIEGVEVLISQARLLSCSMQIWYCAAAQQAVFRHERHHERRPMQPSHRRILGQYKSPKRENQASLQTRLRRSISRIGTLLFTILNCRVGLDSILALFGHDRPVACLPLQRSRGLDDNSRRLGLRLCCHVFFLA